MSVSTWPSSLPPFLRAGYRSEILDARKRRSAGGVPAYKRRFSQNVRRVSLAMEATAMQRAIFDTFYFDTTGGGSSVFTLADPVLDQTPIETTESLPLITASGARLQVAAQWLCLFGDEPPVDEISGGLYRISFSVWVLP